MNFLIKWFLKVQSSQGYWVDTTWVYCTDAMHVVVEKGQYIFSLVSHIYEWHACILSVTVMHIFLDIIS